MIDPDAPAAALRCLAARQHALVSLAQVEALGLGGRSFAYRQVELGLLDRLHPGVFRIAGAPETFAQRVMALVLYRGPHSVASHRAAARLWPIWGFGWVDTPEVTTPRGRNQRLSLGLVHGSLALPPNHVTVLDGIPVTTPARTIFDLAGVMHPKRVERALDDSLAQGLLTLRDLQAVHVRLAKRGRRGTAATRRWLEARGEGYVAPNSDLEAAGRRLLREAGLPDPDPEVDLGDDVGWVGRVDLFYRQAKLVIELDSRRHHSSLLDRDADRSRDNRLMAAGFRVLRFTWEDIHDRPGFVVQQVRAALRAKPPEPNSNLS